MSVGTIRNALIIDSGMRSVGGHNFSYTSAVKRALEKRDARVDVFTNRGLPSDLAQRAGFRPIFSCGAYDHPLEGRPGSLSPGRAQVAPGRA